MIRSLPDLAWFVTAIVTLVTAGMPAQEAGQRGRAADQTSRAEPPPGGPGAVLDGVPRGSTQSRYEAIHVTLPSAKPYDRLRADFEAIVRRAEFDIFGDLSAEEMTRKLLAMPRKDDLMILAQSELGRRLSSVAGRPIRSKQYLVGNPLIASRMIGRNAAASLYVPLRVLIYEDDKGRAVIAYDQPSSLLGQFGDEPIREVARGLDRKLAEIAVRAAE